MGYSFPDRGIFVRVTDSWSARAVGERVVVAHPSEHSWVEPKYLPLSVYIEIHDASGALEPSALRIMRPRAYAGGLDANAIEIHGFQAVRFEWTDGVLDIESDFVTVGESGMLEMTYAAEPERVDGKIRQNRDLATRLGGFIDVAFLIQQAVRHRADPDAQVRSGS